MKLSLRNVEKKLGQLFIVGFPNETPSRSFLNFLSEENIGGVILFGHNCGSHNAIKSSIDLIRESQKSTIPFVAVDQEGGRVCRILKAPAEFSSAWEYATVLGLDRFREDYNRSLLLLESLGINLNLAPVCDIFLNENNTCLKDRCFGSTAEQVTKFVTAAVEITHRNGMLCCMKHFPGLGAAEIDPHERPSKADYDQILWEQREMVPFAACVEAGADLMMTTHLHLPKFDDKMITMSEKVINRLIRQKLFFEGPVITDDLCMKGAEETAKIGERTVAAFNAGHDLLLFGSNLEASMQAFDYFREAFQRGEVSADRVQASLDRVAGIKFKLGKSTLL